MCSLVDISLMLQVVGNLGVACKFKFHKCFIRASNGVRNFDRSSGVVAPWRKSTAEASFVLEKLGKAPSVPWFLHFTPARKAANSPQEHRLITRISLESGVLRRSGGAL
jgi:hypothetical protein